MTLKKNVPNLLSWWRLFSIAPLHLLAVSEQLGWLVVGLAIAGVTDVLDGHLARRWACTSDFGRRLDSIADILLGIAVTAWVIMLYGDAQVHLGLICYILATMITPAAVAFLRYGRAESLHTHTARVCAVCGYGGALYVALSGTSPADLPLTFIALLVTFKALEEIGILLLVDEPQRDALPSIVSYWKAGRISVWNERSGSSPLRSPELLGTRNRD